MCKTKKYNNMTHDQRCQAIENEDLKLKHVLMQQEWRDQQNTIGRLEIQVTKLHSQLKHQAQFCSKAGSILGYCLWKSVQLPEIIKIILKEDKILELSRIMVSVLLSFNNTYQTNTPIANTNEIQFVLSMVGLVVNLTTVKKGQWLFSQDNSCKDVIRLIMDIVTRIPSPSGNQLKRVSYTALYNVSIYSIGSSQIIDAKLVAALNNDINDDNNTNIGPDLRLSALKLLQSLLRNVCTQTTYNILKNNTQLSRLIQLTLAVDAETEILARSILDDFSKAKEHFEAKLIM